MVKWEKLRCYLLLASTESWQFNLLKIISILPSLARTSTWFPLSITWNDMFPSHNTAASIANACSWSSLQIWTMSKASWGDEKKEWWMLVTIIQMKWWQTSKTATVTHNYLNYHELMKLHAIINTINYQALTLVKILVLASHSKVQSICREDKKCSTVWINCKLEHRSREHMEYVYLFKKDSCQKTISHWVTWEFTTDGNKKALIPK